MSRRTLTFRNLSFLMGGLIGTVVLVGGLVLADAYRELVAQTRRVATNLTLTVERDVDHDIRLVDLSLQGIIRATLLPGIDALPPELKQAALFDSAFTQAEFGRFLILDGAGRVVAASGGGRIASTDFSDRAYFLRHRDNPSPDMFVGPALTSRLDGQRVLPVSRRVAAQDGSFGGLVVGTIHPSAFRHVFERLDLGAGGAVTLAHQDGTVLLREPELPAGVAMSPAAAGTPESLPPGPKTAAPPGARAPPPDGGTAPWRNGFGLAVGPDGVLRFYAARRMSGLPLTVVVGFSAWDIMTPWLHKLVVIGSLTLLLCGAAVLLTRALGRELRRRHDAEDRLLAFNRELEARVQREVAARDEARTRLVAGQRMEALGQLAGGIAHDINNVLQVVSSANQALARQCAPASDGRRLSGMIAAAAERGAAVTRRLLVFARQGELRAEPVDVVALVSGLRELLVHTLGGTLAIELRAGRTSPRCWRTGSSWKPCSSISPPTRATRWPRPAGPCPSRSGAWSRRPERGAGGSRPAEVASGIRTGGTRPRPVPPAGSALPSPTRAAAWTRPCARVSSSRSSPPSRSARAPGSASRWPTASPSSPAAGWRSTAGPARARR